METSDRTHHEKEIFKTVGQQYKVRYRFPFAAEFQQERNDMIVDLLGGREEMSVLDLGCGTGVMIDTLAGRYQHIAGIDVSEEMISAIDRSPRFKCRSPIEIIIGDIEYLPLMEHSYDLIVCRSILHHTDSEVDSLKEIYRILKPGGRLVIAEPMNDNPIFRGIRAFMRSRKSYGKTHAIDKAFMAPHLRDLVRSAGFIIDREVRYGFLAYPLCENPDLIPVLKYFPFRTHVARFLRAFDRFMAKIPLIKMLSWYGIMSASRPGER